MNGRRDLGWILAGQFLGALADNALLLVAIALLVERHAPAWNAPALRMVFYLSYVLLSAFGGAAADAWPKKRLLFAINVLKLCGGGLLLTHANPLLAYGLVGMGAAAHAPARYGILSEVAAPGALLAANAWMEVATVLALLLGTVWGSLMLQGVAVLPPLSGGSIASGAALTLAGAYLLAALCTLPVRGRAASNPHALQRPGVLLRNFGRCARLLWRDPQARTSLAVTSAFWAAAAVLQFVVLQWATERLGLALSGAGLLQAAVACGMIAGATAAGRWLREERALAVLPVGLALGAMLAAMALVHSVPAAAALLFAIGSLSGLLVVTMNTLLQRRGRALAHTGQAISVQNWSENLASLVGLAVYGAAVLAHAPVLPMVVVMGMLVSLAMLYTARLGKPLRGGW
ncbi:MAG: Lysophospholipid transporter LplT [Ramlibacter sp.]|nr:Lysophospholipid transporter LplT [Ramlibacter sp.]